MKAQNKEVDFACPSTTQQQVHPSPAAGQAQFWRTVLQGELPVLDLPTDYPRLSSLPMQTLTRQFTLENELCTALRDLAETWNVSFFVLLLGAYKIFLHRWTAQEDLIVAANHVCGQGVNRAVLRTRLSGEENLPSFLEKVKNGYNAACEHGELSLEQLMQVAGIRTEGGRHPIFQTCFSMRSSPWTDEPRLVQNGGSCPLDLALTVEPGVQMINGRVEYNPALFKAETVTRLVSHFQTLLASITNDPGSCIGRLSILPEAERQQVLSEWNRTAVPYSQNKCVHELFEEQVKRTPSAVAVVFEDEHLTYRGLDERANRLAKTLRRLGVGPEVRVGICMMRSLEMIIALYAIHKAGGAYVPMDPAYPAERINFMLEDAQVPVLLTQKALLALLPQTAARVLCVDDRDANEIGAAGYDQIGGDPVTPENLAYVIYTSGSTGKPKGVMVRHRNVVNFFTGMDSAIGAEPGVWLAVTSISFDIHVLELFWTLTRGFKVVLHGDDASSARLRTVRAQAGKAAGNYTLASEIRKHAVTHLQCTPSLAGMMLEDPVAPEALRQVKKFMFGGEALPASLVERIAGYGEIFNMYGPTETTVWSTVHPVTRSGGHISIGRPIANTHIYILDKLLQPVPIGVSGELCIGGAGVVRGYLHRPELTADRFIHSPFSSDPRVRIYRTGDLARYLPDGTIQFLGRLDHQVKLRGFRIELGEIETVMRRSAGVKDSIVSVWQAGPNDTRLVGYFVPQPGANVEPSELRKLLKAKLPDYMVPSVFMQLETLPLTPNGKVDRKALPLPQALNDPDFHDAPEPQVKPAPEPIAEQKGPATKTLPLTEAQREIWYGSQVSDEVSSSFNQSMLIRLNGPLDTQRLLASFRWLVGRHEALRVTFTPAGDAQSIHATMPVVLRREDSSAPGSEAAREMLERLLQEEASQPFDLTNGPLFRVRLVKLSEHEHVMLLTLHHIICDGCSVAILLEDLTVHYSDNRGGARPGELEMSYCQFVEKQEASLNTPERAQAETFWLGQYSHPAPVLELPLDHPRPARRRFNGASSTRLLSAELTQGLKRLSAGQRCTITTVLLAGYYLLLQRLSGQNEIVIGLPITSRSGSGSDRLAGHCVNFLPLRLKVDDSQTVAGHLSRVWHHLMEAHQHQNFTLGSLLQRLNRPREHGRMPLTPVMFNLDWVQEPLKMEHIEVEVQSNPYCQVRFDLSLNVAEREGQLELFGQYAAELLDDTTVGRWLRHYESILSAMVDHINARLDSLPQLHGPDGRVEVFSATAITMEVDGAISPQMEVPREQAPPMGTVEQSLARIWSEVIGVEAIGRHDDFFDVGGHSLLATKVVARITKIFNVELPVRTIFEAPTIAELALCVCSAQAQQPAASAISRRNREPAAEALLKRLEKLSEEELRALLQNSDLKNDI